MNDALQKDNKPSVVVTQTPIQSSLFKQKKDF